MSSQQPEMPLDTIGSEAHIRVEEEDIRGSKVGESEISNSCPSVIFAVHVLEHREFKGRFVTLQEGHRVVCGSVHAHQNPEVIAAA